MSLKRFWSCCWGRWHSIATAATAATGCTALSLWTLFALARGLRAATLGDIAVHRGTMRGIYHFGLAAIAFFTPLPGRIMHRVIFGADNKAGLVAIAAFLLAMAAAVLLQRRYGPRRNARSGLNSLFTSLGEPAMSSAPIQVRSWRNW